MLMLRSRPVLSLIDVQEGFYSPEWGERNNLDAEKNMLTLLQAWRRQDYPVIHVQRCIRKSRFSFTPKFKGISVQRRIWSTRRRILNSQTREQSLHWNRAR